VQAPGLGSPTQHVTARRSTSDPAPHVTGLPSAARCETARSATPGSAWWPWRVSDPRRAGLLRLIPITWIIRVAALVMVILAGVSLVAAIDS
jgi:hypothetical protein